LGLSGIKTGKRSWNKTSGWATLQASEKLILTPLSHN